MRGKLEKDRLEKLRPEEEKAENITIPFLVL